MQALCFSMHGWFVTCGCYFFLPGHLTGACFSNRLSVLNLDAAATGSVYAWYGALVVCHSRFCLGSLRLVLTM